MKPLQIGVIIVTHNSERTIEKTLASLYLQIPFPLQVIVVDSGSRNTDEIKRLQRNYGFELALMPNIGFSMANNFGFRAISADCDYLLFLNPDVIISEGVFVRLVSFLEENPTFAAASPLLVHYDFENDRVTKEVDSAGISCTWYGRFYDSFQGQKRTLLPRTGYKEVMCLCGAFFFVRRTSIKKVLLRGKEVFDPQFFCYKEDIDLSLRLGDSGQKLALLFDVEAYHGRGWDRGKMSRALRLMSAKNELKIHLLRNHFFGVIYATAKWFAVKLFNL